MKKLTILLFGLFALISQSAFAQKLTVTITGVEKGEGQVLVAVYNESGYMKTPLHSAAINAKDETVTVTFDHVAAGNYALAVYQDINKNNELDTSFMGIPSEPFGFSNCTRMPMGTPKFKNVSFSFTESTTQKIKLMNIGF